MAQETKQTQAPILCAMGCGFYGNPRTNRMCSVCYKDFLQRQNNNGRLSSPDVAVGSVGESVPTQHVDVSPSHVPPVFATTDTPLDTSSQTLSQGSATHSEDDSQTADKERQKTQELTALSLDGLDQAASEGLGRTPDKLKHKKNRCFMCRKKVGLTGFDCRCGNIFCAVHRYSDIHSCTFDYKADAAEKIRKENPVVIGEKIQKI